MKVSGNLVIDHQCEKCGDLSTIIMDLPELKSPLVSRQSKQTEEWTDPETKLTWSLHEIDPNNHQQAIDYAKSIGLRLASKEELEIAEKHGFRKHLKITKGWLWSSSVYPFNTDFAYVLNGGDGDVDYFYRGFSYGAAVCVAGP